MRIYPFHPFKIIMRGRSRACPTYIFLYAQAFNPAKTKVPHRGAFLSGIVVHQFLQDDSVWFGETVAAEVGTCHPAPALAFEALWLQVM